jgi:hypothetical protein
VKECAQYYRVIVRLKNEGTKIHCVLQTTLTSSQCSTQASVVGNFCWLNEQKCEALFLCASCTPTAMYVALGRDRERERNKKERKKLELLNVRHPRIDSYKNIYFVSVPTFTISI